MIDDIPEPPSSRPFPPSVREDLRPVPLPRPSMPTSLSSRSAVPNGFKDPLFSPQSLDDSEGPVNSNDVNGQSSREASLLAQNTSHLSIDQGMPTKLRIDSFLSELEQEETDPFEPFLSELPTAYCYDVRMRYHCELEPPHDRRDYHPEDPRRIFSIYRELCVAGLIYDELLTKGPVVSRPLRQIDVRDVMEDEVELVHDKRHWDNMEGTRSMLPRHN